MNGYFLLLYSFICHQIEHPSHRNRDEFDYMEGQDVYLFVDHLAGVPLDPPLFVPAMLVRQHESRELLEVKFKILSNPETRWVVPERCFLPEGHAFTLLSQSAFLCNLRE